VSRAVEETLVSYTTKRQKADLVLKELGADVDITSTIRELEEEMLEAARNLEFEKAALLRDQIRELRRLLQQSKPQSQQTPTIRDSTTADQPIEISYPHPRSIKSKKKSRKT
jgi:excinuclease ABC subunit B